GEEDRNDGDEPAAWQRHTRERGVRWHEERHFQVFADGTVVPRCGGQQKTPWQSRKGRFQYRSRSGTRPTGGACDRLGDMRNDDPGGWGRTPASSRAWNLL